MTLEPYAARLNFMMPSPLTGNEWQLMLAQYMEALARLCTEAGPCVIGHIKGLAAFPDNGFLKISVISPDHPADVNGEVPENLSDLSFVLNVLVYGHTREMIARLNREILDFPDKPWKGHVSVVEVNHGHAHDKETA